MNLAMSQATKKWRSECSMVQDHPFLTQVLFGPLIMSIPADHPLHCLAQRLEYYEQNKLFGGQELEYHNTRALLGYSDAYSDTRAAAPQRGPYYDTITGLFTTYRLLDLVAMHPEVAGLTLPPLSPNTIRTATWDINTLQSFRGWNTVQEWSKTLMDARRIIETQPTDLRLIRHSPSSGSHPSVSIHLLYSLASTHNAKDYCNIVSNFQTAALHLAALLESEVGKDSLPGLEEKLSMIRKGLGSSVDDVQLYRFLNEKSTRNMRSPLQLSLFISPIYLFSTSALYKKPPAQVDLWRVCTSMGNDKPISLKEIELAIWKTVWNISRNADVFTELAALVNCNKWKEWERIDINDPAFLFFSPRSQMTHGSVGMELKVADQTSASHLLTPEGHQKSSHEETRMVVDKELLADGPNEENVDVMDDDSQPPFIAEHCDVGNAGMSVDGQGEEHNRDNIRPNLGDATITIGGQFQANSMTVDGQGEENNSDPRKSGVGNVLGHSTDFVL